MIINKIVNHLMKNGEKKISEDILLKSIKELQKRSKKKSKNIFQLALSYLISVFKWHTVLNRKQKNRDKKIKEMAIFIEFKKIRISITIKFILANTQKVKKNSFYLKLKEEILLILSQPQSVIVQKKNELQKQVLFQKHFFLYYRWS
jgi:ribosomal protein S7